jgi:hypothetical protein
MIKLFKTLAFALPNRAAFADGKSGSPAHLHRLFLRMALFVFDFGKWPRPLRNMYVRDFAVKCALLEDFSNLGPPDLMTLQRVYEQSGLREVFENEYRKRKLKVIAAKKKRRLGWADQLLVVPVAPDARRGHCIRSTCDAHLAMTAELSDGGGIGD